MEQQQQHSRHYEGYDNARKFADFDTMLATELASIQERGLNDYIIFKKTENAHLKRKPRNLDPSVLYQRREVPLVMWLHNASTTVQQVNRYESKGWLIVASSFSDKMKAEAKKDARLNDVIIHCQVAMRYVGSVVPVGKSATITMYEQAMQKREEAKAQPAITETTPEVKQRGRPKKQHESVEG